MAIRIIADAMTLEIVNRVVATTRVGEHAAADGKRSMEQVGPRGQTFAAIRSCG
jgi:hypothetical protein